jgi:CHAT domain-containing protein
MIEKLDIAQPEIKQISYDTYETYFMEALRNPEVNNNNTIFFRLMKDNSIILSFSWENFLVMVVVSEEEIMNLYPLSDLQHDSEIRFSDLRGHPSYIKFIEQATFGRGIPEK